MFTATSWRSIASSPSTGIILKNARTKGCNRVIGRIFKKRKEVKRPKVVSEEAKKGCSLQGPSRSTGGMGVWGRYPGWG